MAPGKGSLSQPDVDITRVAVWGVSLGGYYSVRVAAALGGQIAACVSLSGPFDLGSCWDDLPSLTRRTFKFRSRAATDHQAKEMAALLSLEEHIGGVTAPLLVVAGRKDRIFPWQQAERLMASAGRDAELLMLEAGNHGCANVAPWHRPYTADWLAAKLGAAPPNANDTGPEHRDQLADSMHSIRQTIVRGIR
jgi:dipeptidyl aminopeptidase/acylaminoacyl peptidase